MKTNKDVLWTCAIQNSICVICWTILAVIFNKWWIALFGILFWSSIRTKEIKRFYRICDHCGKHSEYADSEDAALAKAKAAGWIHYEDGNKDYCPNCKESYLC